MRKRESALPRLRVSWVDALLVALLVGGFLGGLWLLGRARRDAAPSGVVRYGVALTVDAEEVDRIASHLAIGKEVRSANGTAPLGRITALSREAVSEAAVEDGRIVEVNDPGRVRFLITVEGEGVLRAGEGLRISDIRIAAGLVGDFRFGALLGAGQILFAEWEATA